MKYSAATQVEIAAHEETMSITQTSIGYVEIMSKDGKS